ncbi:hypothetical protein FRB99_000487 [Tulasnella sp. 403]|nr:hypothetical protein FRB99_000487 [Tulasnella sp. 403]
MRVSTLVFALAASLASAQSIADLPECALSCLAQVDTGGCDITDQLCLCKSQAFFTSSTTCVRKTCSPADDQKTAQVSAAICQALGVTLPSPPASSPGETTPASAPASTPAATVSATSVASSTHDHPSSAAGGAGAPATTHTGTASAPGTPNTSGAPTVSE